MKTEPTLRRAVSLPLLTLYGLGTIIGAGIFVLIGKVVGIAGMQAPLAFLLAATIAGLTALSYAEMASWFPRCTGEVLWLGEIFHSRALARITGIAIMAAGTISAATVAGGAAGYLQQLVSLPIWLLILIIIVLLGGLAAWGIAESVATAALTTSVTILALLLVAALNLDALGRLPEQWQAIWPASDQWHGILLAAFVAFFAFLGFEDMINLAEETTEPARTLPAAILLALLGATLLYLLIALTAVLALPADELAESEAPLVTLVGERSETLKLAIAAISAVAVIDGILVQIIKAARVLYGMSRQGLLPGGFARIHPERRTPVTATIAISLLVLIAALSLPLLTLAEITSLITLMIFVAVNLALWRLKCRAAPKARFSVPTWVPVVALLLSSALLLAFLISAAA